MDEFITKRMDEARQRVIRARHIADVAAAAATSEFSRTRDLNRSHALLHVGNTGGGRPRAR
jgi:hypothetical protein